MTSDRDPNTELLLPTFDDDIFAPGTDIDALAWRWDAQAQLRPMTAEQMSGADVRAQRFGIPGDELMEQAGTATAAAARALMVSTDRAIESLVLILCGPGNNGGDGLVAARYLARIGVRSEVVMLSSAPPPTRDAKLNWERLDGVDLVERVFAARNHDAALFLNGIERAALVIDAMLGSGAHGGLREPVRTAVDVAVRARESEVPVLAVDTPTSLDLTSGVPNPVSRSHARVRLAASTRKARVGCGVWLKVAINTSLPTRPGWRRAKDWAMVPPIE